MVKFSLSFLIGFTCFFSFTQKNLDWKLLHPISHNWITVNEDCYVQQVLNEIGDLPDPSIGVNAEQYSWIEDHIWTFKTTFEINSAELKNEFIYFSTESIDTYAEIVVNGVSIRSTENAFISYKIDIKSAIILGNNTIEIHFTPPVLKHKKKWKKKSFEYPAPNDVSPISIAPLTRKPQYHFGWDWTYRMNTIGFKSKPVLEFIEKYSIIEKRVRTLRIDKNKAIVEFTLKIDNDSVKRISWDSRLFGKEKVSRDKGVFRRVIEIPNPQLWWPVGYGEPHLYNDAWKAKTRGERIEVDVKFGIRKSELIQEKDEWGRSYYFKINGKRVFCKGGNMIPSDVFPNKVTKLTVEKLVSDAFEANFNMIRVWGGGFYPDDFFYEKCDELGIMVWQDFMFACAMYPADDEFLKNVKEEFNQQIPRISNHPCVVLFNGNNEVDVAWKNWGFKNSYNLNKSASKTIQTDYNKLFKNVLPNFVNTNSDIPYIHTSPLSNWGKAEDFNFGSQHYWGVWHGKDPMIDFAKKTGRFNAEYGFQSFPEMKTINYFADSVDLSLSSDVMKFHQKSYVGNQMIAKHADILFGETNDFKEFVYNSQLTQAIAVSYAVSAHRLDAPRCGGTIFWQINDCWPAPTWSSIDYFGNWKALHYQIKRDYEPMTVLKSLGKNDEEAFFFISDLYDTVNQRVLWEVYNDLGENIYTDSTIVFGNEPFKKQLDLRIDESSGFVKFYYENSLNERKSRTFQFGKSSHRSSRDAFLTEIVHVDSVSNFLVMEVETKDALRYFSIQSLKNSIKVENNFIHVLPGKNQFTIHYSGNVPKKEDFIFEWK